MFEYTNMPDAFFSKLRNTADFGAQFRRERLALGKTQAEVAQTAGVRRQTIADMERGHSVTMLTVLSALSALGKALEIVDLRHEMDRLPDFMHDDDA
jgi:DNA-binding XRE family transcriptional regulator